MPINNKYLIYIYLLLLSLSVCALTHNAIITHYIGNNYFCDNTLLFIANPPLIYLGLKLTLGEENYVTKLVLEIAKFLAILALIALATNAAQFTPFATIDNYIIKLERHLNIDSKKYMLWFMGFKDKTVYEVFIFIYNLVVYQLILYPLLCILLLNKKALQEFYFHLIFTVIIGFSIYYFFPTIAPASAYQGNFDFLPEQYATGIKFKDIHNNLEPNTMAGGLISLPSFHVIWALLCLNLIKDYKWLFYFTIPITISITISCVLLGWHYIMDIIASFIIVIISLKSIKFLQSTTKLATLKNKDLSY